MTGWGRNLRVTNGKNRSGELIVGDELEWRLLRRAAGEGGSGPRGLPAGWVLIRWAGAAKPRAMYRPFGRKVAFAGGLTSLLVREGF